MEVSGINVQNKPCGSKEYIYLPREDLAFSSCAIFVSEQKVLKCKKKETPSKSAAVPPSLACSNRLADSHLLGEPLPPHLLRGKEKKNHQACVENS